MKWLGDCAALRWAHNIHSNQKNYSSDSFRSIRHDGFLFAGTGVEKS